VDLVGTLVSSSDLRQLRDQLPESEDDGNWRKLFEVIDAGGWGDAHEEQTSGEPRPDDETGGEGSSPDSQKGSLNRDRSDSEAGPL